MKTTKMHTIYVLCLEDDLKDAELFREMLHDSGFLVEMDIVSNKKQFISSLKACHYDVILADYSLPGFDAPAALKQATMLKPDVPFICVSGTIGEDTAVELLKQGATDYVLKDRIGRLAFAVQRALEEAETKKDWKQAQAELQEKEDEIKESELRYKYMFENNPQPMWIYDLDTLKFLEVNHAAVVHYGFSREEFLSMTLKDIRPKEDINAMLKDIELTRKEYNTAREWRHLKKNGELIFVGIVSYAIVYGKIPARHVMATDITNRKLAEEALRESEEQLKAIFENSINPILVADDAGNYLKVNQAAAKMFQYPVGKLLQMNVGDLRTTSSRDAAARYQEYISKGFEIGEFDISQPDGTEAFAQYHAVRIRENFNLSILSDITERKKAEDELIKLSRAVEQSPVSILITDINGNIEYVNAKVLTLTGYELEELKGKNPRIFSSGKKSREEYRDLWETVLSGKEWRDEMYNRKKNGELYWEFVSISAIKNKMGHITHLLAVKEDITERKQAEKNLQELEIARNTARFKQNFLANMSHEIRTPLTGVLGMIDILELTQLNGDQLDYVNTIKASGENLKEIINLVLDYSKIEAGKIEIHPMDFEFQSVLQSAEMLYRNITRPGVKVITHLDPDIPRFIRTDRSRLSQVINNLVSNAIKFTHKGSVSVQARLLSQITETQQVMIEVKIVDTGIGIPAHLQEKLFCPFSQIDDNDTRYYEGTGLGLSISRELVGLLGGEIGVESDSNKGSTFWFTFTAQVAENQQVTKPLHHRYTTHQSLHILLAEDKVVNQKVVGLMLKALGHTVTIANNGAQAIELYESGKFDLILMDIQMPVMNGVKATQILKERFTDLPPVICLSANAFEGDREKYMALGMDEYLAKPIKSDDFRKMIQLFFASDMEAGLS